MAFYMSKNIYKALGGFGFSFEQNLRVTLSHSLISGDLTEIHINM